MPRRGSDPSAQGTAKRGARRTRTNARDHLFHSPQSDPAAMPHRSHSHVVHGPVAHAHLSPRDLYLLEKARRASRGGEHRTQQDMIDEAKREYLALLASEAGGPKGGRPRKNAARPKAAASEDLVEDGDELAEDGGEELDEAAEDEEPDE